MNLRKRLRRKPDGRPRMKSVHDLLRSAIDDETYQNLPGKDNPLDLKGYFAAGEGHRMANKILKDNQVLPAHLQYRVDVETHLQNAEDLRSQGRSAIQQLELDIQRTSMETCDLRSWPPCFSEPSEVRVVSRRQFLARANHLVHLIQLYNSRIESLIPGILESFGLAQKSIQNIHILYATLPYGAYGPDLPSKIDLEQKEKELKLEFPLLPSIPPDCEARFKKYPRRQQPSLFQRIFSFS